jgi:hypothetical protein
MSAYYVRQKPTDEVVADAAVQVAVIIGIGLAVIIGTIIAGFASEIIRVYAQHGQPGQPEAAKLRRARHLLVGAWVVGTLVLITGVNVLMMLGAVLITGSTVAFVLFVCMLGQVLGEGEVAPSAPVGELDTYLAPFSEPAAAPAGHSPQLRVIHSNGVHNGR